MDPSRISAGPETLPEEDLAKNRTDPHLDLLAHPLCDDWHKERSADLSKVTLPLLSCANWGGQGIHPRGNFNGWLRASHRRLDPRRSRPWQPFHSHDRVEPLTPGDVYECDVEILPTSIVIPAGWTLALTVRGKDYEYAGELSEFAKTFHYGTRSTGGMTHADPINRPRDRFGGTVSLHAGGARESYLLVPIIPARG